MTTTPRPSPRPLLRVALSAAVGAAVSAAPTAAQEGEAGSFGPAATAWWQETLMWFPNRALDFLDVFKADLGVGPSAGVVVRATRSGQVGYRAFGPASARLGLFGRREPYLIETDSEYGAGPRFKESVDRPVCDGEVGLGLDVLVAGAYVGVCLEEAVDFLAGLVFVDVSGDDYRGAR